jgi:hypothetical protein
MWPSGWEQRARWVEKGGRDRECHRAVQEAGLAVGVASRLVGVLGRRSIGMQGACLCRVETLVLCLQLSGHRQGAQPAVACAVPHAETRCALPCCVKTSCAAQVYRGKWCSVDIAAKEYLAVEDGETELHTSGQEPTEAARQKAQVCAEQRDMRVLWLFGRVIRRAVMSCKRQP